MSQRDADTLKGTSVVITGGARGLGLAMTQSLAAAGAGVLMVGTDNTVLKEAEANTAGEVASLCLDVTKEGAGEEIVDVARERFGSLEVLIHNAGIGMSNIRGGDRFAVPIHFWEVTPEWMRRFYEVHVMAPFILTQAALPLMRQQEFGRIIMITTSLSSMLGGENTPYGSVKASSEALCSAMANDLRDTGITANVLIPGGAADTRFIPDSPLRPRELLVKTEVMGPPAVFLASRDADGFTGKRIIAKDWQTGRSLDENLAAASTPIGWPAKWS